MEGIATSHCKKVCGHRKVWFTGGHYHNAFPQLTFPTGWHSACWPSYHAHNFLLKKWIIHMVSCFVLCNSPPGFKKSDWRLVLVLGLEPTSSERKPYMAGLKAEVYFWFLSKSRGRFFRIGIGLHILWPLLSCFAPLTVPSITKVASWSKMAAKTPNITVYFTQQEGKKGGKIKSTLIMILPRCCTSDFHLYPIGLHLVIKLYLSAQGIGNCTLYFW